jgi:hypothetical protein
MNLVILCVHRPDIVIPIYPKAMGIGEEVPAPGTQVVAVRIEDNERIPLLPAVKDVHFVF